MIWALAAFAVVSSSASAVRWLRVAQREHYLAGVTRFARMWWSVDVGNLLLLIFGVAGVVAAVWQPLFAMAPLGIAVVGPIGLGLKGRTSRLAWTSRLRRLAAVAGLVVVVFVVLGALADSAPLLAAIPLLVPVILDGALLAVAGYERSASERWVSQAAGTLQAVSPTVVAITGSYGKTSTKNLVAHLVSSERAVVASPASFNNRMGLARAVNEHLGPGTSVFVAEMGTYGAGEIRELCGWIPPDVAVMTALGPVHLERMGTIEAIAAAKREILDAAPVGVVAVDHPLLARIAGEERANRRIITTAVDDVGADVIATEAGEVSVAGDVIGGFDPTQAHPANVASAVGVVVALGIDPRTVASRLGTLPEVAHRRTVGRSDRGFWIIDDTFNSNPAGAASAVALLATLGAGRKVVVTPGMVELGREQDPENRRFMQVAADNGVTDVVVVGRTNRAALVDGAEAAAIGSVIVVPTRDDAVAWVRGALSEGDAVLYENDLPDHYP